MNSYILIAKDQKNREEYIEKFCLKNKISPFDQMVISSETPSIGIEVIRDMQKHVFFKPVKGEKRIIIFENAHTLTIEAQNALLKVLEEPPIHTYFFLSAATDASFLPTIFSRCRKIHLEEEKTEISEEEKKEFLDTYRALSQDNISFKLSLAETLSADKEKAREYLVALITLLHEKLLKTPEESRKVANVIEKLQGAYTLIQTTNVNLRLLLEHTFLNI